MSKKAGLSGRIPGASQHRNIDGFTYLEPGQKFRLRLQEIVAAPLAPEHWYW
jgi:hypothetical protein